MANDLSSNVRLSICRVARGRCSGFCQRLGFTLSRASYLLRIAAGTTAKSTVIRLGRRSPSGPHGSVIQPPRPKAGPWPRTEALQRVARTTFKCPVVPEPDRIRELDDALKEAERRVAEMRAERDQAFQLVEQMKEHVSDVDTLIDSWIEAFEMQLSEDGKRTRDALPESIKKILADAVALRKQAKGLGKK